jgi:hypothetical protein
MGERTIRPGYSRAGRSYASDTFAEIVLKPTVARLHELKRGPITPRADIAGLAARPRLSPQVPKVSVMAALKVTIEAHVEEVGEIRPAAGVVALHFISRRCATLASPASREGTREIEARPVMRAGSPVVSGLATRPANSERRFLSDQFGDAPDCEADDGRADQKLA